MVFSRIAGTGSYLPEKVLTNHDLEKIVDTSDEWIYTRTGIRERHIAADNELSSDLALRASECAIDSAGVGRDEIDLIVLATSTPDMIFPSTACLLQAKLGIRTGAAFDVQAVCSGFVYALAVADNFIRLGQSRHALVVGSEIFSRILNWNDRTTCVLFGDGAGAVVLCASNAPGILSTHLHADGSYSQLLAVPGSVCAGKVQGSPFLVMDGGAVFRFAVKALEDTAREALVANGMLPAQLDWLVPHQANIRIIDATTKRLGVAPEKVVLTVDKHANTSAASIPLALDEAARDGRIRPGHTVLLEGIGGGFAWGSALLKF
jgi:3-oxoacyl-[acyl-carrier-protein] synthase-3